MNRRAGCLFVACLLFALAASHAAPARPNIVLILADDMGFSDLGCYGGEIKTPNLDRLASGGLRFSQFYNCAVCGPSRAALMSGLYPQQAGVVTWTGVLNNHCVTAFELLKRAGYTTCAVGRLDMTVDGDWYETAKLDHYLDRYWGGTGRTGPGGNYFEAVRSGQFFCDGKPYMLPKNTYKTDLVTDFAVKFISETVTNSKPFFLYLAHYAPHWPLHAKPADIAKYRELYRKLGWDEARTQRYQRLKQLGLISPNCPLSPRDARVPAWKDAEHKDWEAERMAVYAAQVDSLDQSVGRVLEALRRTGADTNTLILFLSDNGASDQVPNGPFDKPGQTWRLDGTPTRVGNRPDIQPGPADNFVTGGPPWADVANTPFRGHKNGNFEGAIATPLIAWWPRVIKKTGAVSDEPGHIMDLMATCLDVAGVKYPARFDGRDVLPISGKSLLPVLKGGAGDGHKELCWATGGCRAIRAGQWKLVSPKGGKAWELFDVAADRAETRDLATKYPDRVKDLAARWESWSESCAAKP
jgi:arylsulfatase A-like enzyme